jgi:hypothetical protein
MNYPKLGPIRGKFAEDSDSAVILLTIITQLGFTGKIQGALMSFSPNPPRSHTYVLTLWEERDLDADSPAVWRYRLEDPRTGKRRGFSTVEGLMDALRREVNEARKDGRGG